jgi:hypothetical protein
MPSLDEADTWREIQRFLGWKYATYHVSGYACAVAKSIPGAI